jgi:hypothetical protein
MKCGHGIALALAFFLSACLGGSIPSSRSRDFDPNTGLVPSQQIAREQLMRQRLHYRFQEQEGSLQSVVQVLCGEVVVIGLSPIGTRLFTIRQSGLAVSVQPASSVDWPFSPERILLDVHRTFFYPLADAPMRDGAQTRQVAGLQVIDEWKDGRLLERHIEAKDSDPPRSVTIHYEGGWAGEGPPPRIVLRDEGIGYEIEVESLEHRELRCEKNSPK